MEITARVCNYDIWKWLLDFVTETANYDKHICMYLNQPVPLTEYRSSFEFKQNISLLFYCNRPEQNEILQIPTAQLFWYVHNFVVMRLVLFKL